jgi:type I restriction enzyme S subunit
VTSPQKGWPTAALGDVCEVAPRDPPLPADAPFVSMNAVTVGERWPTYYEVRGTRSGVRAQAGDVLFARITPCLENGKLAQVPPGTERVGGSTEFIVVRPGDLVDAGYLYFWCMEPSVRSNAKANMAGATGRMRLGATDLGQFRIPLPPLNEQRRIVALLEERLSRLDAADAYLEAAQRRAATLNDQIFNNELAVTEAENVSLGGLLTARLANGKSVPTEDGGFPVLRLTALRDGRVDLAERKAGAWSATDAARFLVQRGDFLIARGNGSLRLVGRGGLVTDDPDPVAYPDTLIRARPDPATISPEFLALVWNAPAVRRQIEGAAKTTAGIYKINQKDLAAVQVPVPSLIDQERIARAVTAARESVAKLESDVGRSRMRGAALRRALLAAAFSGQLTAEMATA